MNGCLSQWIFAGNEYKASNKMWHSFFFFFLSIVNMWLSICLAPPPGPQLWLIWCLLQYCYSTDYASLLRPVATSFHLTRLNHCETSDNYWGMKETICELSCLTPFGNVIFSVGLCASLLVPLVLFFDVDSLNVSRRSVRDFSQSCCMLINAIVTDGHVWIT